MKYPVYADTEPSQVPKDANALHLVRPLPAPRLKAFLERHPGVQLVEMSKSTHERLSEAARSVLREREVVTHKAQASGRAIEIPLEKMQQVMEMRADHRPLREISEVTGVPKSTAHYLLRYAQRIKVKQGGRVMHLQ